MELSQLYPRGTKMSEVAPDFQGMSLKLWQRLDMERQAEAHRKTLDPKDAPLSKQRL